MSPVTAKLTTSNFNYDVLITSFWISHNSTLCFLYNIRNLLLSMTNNCTICSFSYSSAFITSSKLLSQSIRSPLLLVTKRQPLMEVRDVRLIFKSGCFMNFPPSNLNCSVLSSLMRQSLSSEESQAQLQQPQTVNSPIFFIPKEYTKMVVLCSVLPKALYTAILSLGGVMQSILSQGYNLVMGVLNISIRVMSFFSYFTCGFHVIRYIFGSLGESEQHMNLIVQSSTRISESMLMLKSALLIYFDVMVWSLSMSRRHNLLWKLKVCSFSLMTSSNILTTKHSSLLFRWMTFCTYCLRIFYDFISQVVSRSHVAIVFVRSLRPIRYLPEIYNLSMFIFYDFEYIFGYALDSFIGHSLTALLLAVIIKSCSPGWIIELQISYLQSMQPHSVPFTGSFMSILPQDATAKWFLLYNYKRAVVLLGTLLVLTSCSSNMISNIFSAPFLQRNTLPLGKILSKNDYSGTSSAKLTGIMPFCYNCLLAFSLYLSTCFVLSSMPANETTTRPKFVYVSISSTKSGTSSFWITVFAFKSYTFSMSFQTMSIRSSLRFLSLTQSASETFGWHYQRVKVVRLHLHKSELMMSQQESPLTRGDSQAFLKQRYSYFGFLCIQKPY